MVTLGVELGLLLLQQRVLHGSLNLRQLGGEGLGLPEQILPLRLGAGKGVLRGGDALGKLAAGFLGDGKLLGKLGARFVGFLHEGGFFDALLPVLLLLRDLRGLLGKAVGALLDFVLLHFGCAVLAIGFQQGKLGGFEGVLLRFQAA